MGDVEFKGSFCEESRLSLLCNVLFTASRIEHGKRTLLEEEGMDPDVSTSLP